MTGSKPSSQDGPREEFLGGIGRLVGWVLLAVCFLVATAVVLSWISSLVIGTGLAFWPAVTVALGLLVILIVASSR